MQPSFLLRSVSVTMLLSLPGLASAQIYSWRDSEGKAHYSDQAPTGVTTQRKIEPLLAPAEETQKARRALAKQEMDFRKRQLDAAESAAKTDKDKTETAEKQRNCELARSHVMALESGQRLSRTDNKGERVYLDDEARARELTQARGAVDAWCK